MSTWTLGAIMVIVPTSFYLGTALNRHYSFTEPSSVPGLSSPSTSLRDPAEVKEAIAQPTQLSSADELAMLQSRFKSLKTSRNALEMELKDNREKLRRLEERIKKEADKQTQSTS